MAKTKISEYDSTAANNTDIDGINIAEGCPPSGLNNSLRAIMSHLKDGLGAGTPVFLDQTNNRVGIGTTSPSAPTEIVATSSGAATDLLHLRNNATATSTGSTIKFVNSTSGNSNSGSAEITATRTGTNTGDLIFSTSNSSATITERMRIDSSGRVGIGTTTITEKLEVAGDIRLQNSLKFRADDDAENGSIALSDSDELSLNSFGTSGHVTVKTGSSNTERMRITSSGSVGIGTTSPNSISGFTGLTLDNTSGSFVDLEESGTLIGRFAVASNQLDIHNKTANPITFNTNNAERMRIDSSGNVGIGITPRAKLDIFGTGAGNARVLIEGEGGADPYINFLANNTQHWSIGVDDSDSDKFKIAKNSALGTNDYFVVDTSGNTTINSFIYLDYIRGKSDNNTGINITGSDVLAFQTGGTEQARFDDSGNLMIGGTNGNPVGNHVSQTIINGTNGMGVHRDGGTPFKLGTNGNREIAIFHITGADVGSIDVSGSSTSYNTSSDYRLKENVTDLTNGITRLKQLSPKRFNFIKDPDTTLDGFLAHEAQAVVPEASNHEKDATRTVTKGVYNSDGIVIFEDIEEEDWKSGKETTKDEKGNTINGKYPSDSTWSASKDVPVYQGMDATKLVPLLTAALQEAIAKIETLETKVAALEG